MKVNEYLERKGINITFDGGYYWNCIYKGNEICIVKNSGISHTFALYINKETIMTKGLLRTIIGKILRLEEVR